MRFFTMAWWCGYQTENKNAERVFADYSAHIAAIRYRLPPDLLAAEETVSLHDAQLREMRLLPADGLLSLTLDSFSGDERFILTYAGVERFESTADPKIGMGGGAGYGDLGYCEVDVLPSGAFEHRFLFATGIELVIVFRGFRLARESTIPATRC